MTGDGRAVRIASYLFFVALVPLAVWMALDAGITTDEMVQRKYGDLVLAWYRSGFRDAGALSFKNLHLYGGLFDLLAQAWISTGIVPIEDYDMRHVLSSLVAVLGVYATWLTARSIAGPRAALLSAAALALTPAWLGHGLFNPKDIPFGAAAAFVMFTSVRLVMQPAPVGWKDALGCAVALGITLAIRAGGMFMLVYPVLAIALRAAVDVRESTANVRPIRSACVSLARLVAVLPVVWLLMISAWPWAQLSPLRRPFEAAVAAAHFRWQGLLRFEGKVITEADIPAHYLATWFGLTLPDFYALALLCALALAFAFRARPVRSAPVAAACLLIVCAFGPFLAVVLTHPIIYDGHRHFLFLLPPLAALAGLAFDAFERIAWPKLVRAPVLLLAGCLAALTAYEMATLHPFEYIYFNHLSGGLSKQASRFETDYWGSSYREGFDWVVKHYDPGGTRRIFVSSCSADKLLSYYRNAWHADRFVVPRDPRKAEVFLDLTKPKCGKVSGTELHRIERRGVPLLYVLHPTRE